MYTPHQQTIAQFALENPRNLYQVGLFTLATINMHLEYVPHVVRRMHEQGSTSKELAPNTRRGMEALASEAQALYDDFQGWAHMLQGEEDKEQAMRIAECAIFRLVQLPGFGIVKAAFFVQLVLGITACLDRWNLRRAGLDEKLFQRIPASAEALQTRIQTYVRTVEQLGGSAYLWDAWCAALSIERPHVWPSAESVSQFHVTCICGEE